MLLYLKHVLIIKNEPWVVTVSKHTSMFVLQMKMKSKVISMGKFIKIESDWVAWDHENYIFSQKWLRWGLYYNNIGPRIDYNEVWALRGQQHMPSKN